MKRKHRGQALVETALVVPFLAAVFTIVVNLGDMLLAQIELHAIVREAALLANRSRSYSDDEIREQMMRMTTRVRLSAGDIEISQHESLTVGKQPVQAIRIHLRHRRRLLIPMFYSPIDAVVLESRLQTAAVGWARGGTRA